MGPGIPFVISAPSGAGKSTLIRGLLERVPGLGFSVSHTSRPPRRGEVDGTDYHFVERAQFEAMAATGAFVEYAEVHGNLYGTSYAAIGERLAGGQDVILDIDVQGARQVTQGRLEAVTVFILPPSWEELRRRIEARRSESAEVIARRLDNAREELKAASRYQYLVINDRVETAVEELAGILLAERCRTARRRDALRALGA